MERMTVKLTGVSVFRDIGGCATSDGRRVVQGQVFRSSDLAGLTREDHHALRSLCVRLVCDLRSEVEREARPSAWPVGLETEWLVAGLLDVRAGEIDLRQILIADPSPAGARRMMMATYDMLPRAAESLLPRLFEQLASGQLPALVHCTAGKDRTGFVCACLLLALQVPWQTVLTDYLTTSEHAPADVMAARIAERLEMLVGPSVAQGMLTVLTGVDASYLEAAFAAVERDYGSIEGYFRTIGIGPELLARLRARLLAVLEPGE